MAILHAPMDERDVIPSVQMATQPFAAMELTPDSPDEVNFGTALAAKEDRLVVAGERALHFFHQVDGRLILAERKELATSALTFSGNDLIVGGGVPSHQTSSDPTHVVLERSAVQVQEGSITRVRTQGSQGYSLTAYQDRLVVGRYAKDASSGAERGRVSLFTRGPDLDLVLLNSVQSRSETFDQFGTSIVLTGNFLLVGAPEGEGRVDFFMRSGKPTYEYWSAVNPPKNCIGFGRAIACDGYRLAISGWDAETKRGRVWLYVWIGGAPRDQLFVEVWESSDPNNGESFGESLALGPGWLAVGAPREGSSGRVIVRPFE